MAARLSEDDLRLLRGLKKRPVFRGAINLFFGDQVDDPEKRLRSLQRRGLANIVEGSWTTTETGETELARYDVAS